MGGEGADSELLEYLARRYPRFSRGEWLQRIDSGRVLVDGVAASARAVVKPGQVIVWARPPWEEPDVPLSFAILYRDADLLAVAKPSGLPTMPGGGEFLAHTLLSRVRRHFPAASPLHRLGRATSGIVLFACTRNAHASIAREWREGRVVKVYRALVAGSPDADRFCVNVPIGRVPHPVLRMVHAACVPGKASLSDVTVLERRGDRALVEVRITTGRPHQIRIHLAAAGHPLIGDPLYAPGGVPAHDCRALPGDVGYYLHAGLLGFSHPATGEWIEVVCAPPPVLRRGTRLQPDCA